MATKMMKRYADGDVVDSEEKTVAAPKRPDQSRLKVTKEELDASGLSLRDYMNKQLGLKRRDGSAPAATPAKAQMAAKAGPSATPYAGSQMGPGSSSAKNTAPAKKENQGSMSIGDTDYAKTVRARGDFDGIKNMLADRQARIARDNAALSSGMKKGGTVKKMASGGSASSRADGIASKGKTKGMMR